MAQLARTPAQVIAGEAVSGTSQERWDDMKAIASVIANRAAMLGVSIQDVIGAPNQFDAFGKPLPAGTGSLVDMAQAALDDVATNGPVTNATYYSTPATQDNLPSGLQPVAETAGHIFQVDPAMRGIITAQGVIAPDASKLPSNVGQDPLQQAINAPYEANGLTNGVTSLSNAPATAVTSQSLPGSEIDPAFGANGLLSGAFPASSFAPTPDASATAGALAGLGLPANAAVGGILGNVPASASLGTAPSLDASASASPVENASVDARMGVADPGFDTSRFGDAPVANVDPSRFGDTALASAMQTPTSYMSQPVNNYADMAAAGPVSAPVGVQGILGAMNQPNLAASAGVPMSASLFSPAVDPAAAQVSATPTGVLGAAPDLSASAQAQPSVSTPSLNNFGDLASAGPMSAPVSAQPTGILGSPSALTASATATPVDNSTVADRMGMPTGILSGYQATPTNTPAENAIGGILGSPSISPSAINGYQQMASSALQGGITNLSGNTLVGPTGVATSNMPTVADTTTQPSDTALGISSPGYSQFVADSYAAKPASVPSLDTVSIPDQPTIAGPVNTPAVTQQQPSLSGSFPSAPKPGGLLGGLINKQSLTGGLLGSLAAGPIGGILGAALGNQISKNGGLTGLLSGASPAINNIGSGLQNVASVYGGGMPAGTQATTNNGGTVTAASGGWTHYTDPNGVTTSFGPNQTTAGYFGGPDADTGGANNGGYSSPGLF